MVEDPQVGRFFQNVPMAALKTHQIKFYKVCFGDKEDLADSNELVEYMMLTHTRLFEEMGMTVADFDLMVECYMRGVQVFDLDDDVVKELGDAFAGLRPIFEHCEKVAVANKHLTAEEKEALPVSTAAMLGSDEPQRLPDLQPVVPDWLPEVLCQVQKRGLIRKPDPNHVVRAWSAKLTEVFGFEDENVGETFMDMGYMQHHVYATTFLKLAFVKEGIHKEFTEIQQYMDVIRYPRGRSKRELARVLYDRMIELFTDTCEEMYLEKRTTVAAIEQLKSFSKSFSNKKIRKVGFTTHALHPSRKQNIEKKVVVVAGSRDSCEFSSKELLDGSSGSLWTTETRSVNSGSSRPFYDDRVDISKKRSNWRKRTPFVAKILRAMRLGGSNSR